jgi:hypothetical protein
MTTPCVFVSSPRNQQAGLVKQEVVSRTTRSAPCDTVQRAGPSTMTRILRYVNAVRTVVVRVIVKTLVLGGLSVRSRSRFLLHNILLACNWRLKSHRLQADGHSPYRVSM